VKTAVYIVNDPKHLMRASMDQRFVPEGGDSLRSMADLAVSHAQMFLDVHCLTGPGMQGARSVADLAAGVFKPGGSLGVDKPAGPAVAGGVAGVTPADFIIAKAFF